jgi:2-keto-3-deoxy-L-rhamnonate aldolase RhmA
VPRTPAIVRNVAREKLEQGQLSLGVGVRMTHSVEIAKAMAVAGFDWLFLDMEHGVMSLEACAQIVLCCRALRAVLAILATATGAISRNRKFVDSPLEGDGFEPVWVFSCQVVIFGV